MEDSNLRARLELLLFSVQCKSLQDAACFQCVLEKVAAVVGYQIYEDYEDGLMYIYENHVGGLFTSEWELTPEECYCET